MAYTKIPLFFFLMMALCSASMAATTYQVGDSAGWNSNGTDYQTWASTKTFYLGDTIVFNYKPGMHNVVQVTKEDYEACSTSLVLGTYTSGKDSILLYSPGDYYYICSYGKMCKQGQKVEIKVSPATAPSQTSVTNQSQPSADHYFTYEISASTALDFYCHLWLMILASCALTLCLH